MRFQVCCCQRSNDGMIQNDSRWRHEWMFGVYSSCHGWNKVPLIHCLIIIFKIKLEIWWIIPSVFRHTHAKVHYQEKVHPSFYPLNQIHFRDNYVSSGLDSSIRTYRTIFGGNQDLLAIYFGAFQGTRLLTQIWKPFRDGSNLPLPTGWKIPFTDGGFHRKITGKSTDFMEMFVAGQSQGFTFDLCCYSASTLDCWVWLVGCSEGHEAGEPGHVPTRSFYEAQLFQESSRDYSAIDIILDNIFNFYHQICFIEFYRWSKEV